MKMETTMNSELKWKSNSFPVKENQTHPKIYKDHKIYLGRFSVSFSFFFTIFSDFICINKQVSKLNRSVNLQFCQLCCPFSRTFPSNQTEQRLNNNLPVAKK